MANFNGSNADDEYFGGSGDGRNTISTGSGADRITAGSGDDQINAGTGNDTIYAGGGVRSPRLRGPVVPGEARRVGIIRIKTSLYLDCLRSEALL